MHELKIRSFAYSMVPKDFAGGFLKLGEASNGWSFDGFRF